MAVASGDETQAGGWARGGAAAGDDRATANLPGSLHPTPSRFYFLDGIRGLAALAVLLFHIAGFLQARFATGGYLAVDLFFVLSGFVIANAYDRRLATTLSAAGLFRVRLVRLYPLFALGLLLGMVRSVGRIAHGARDTLSASHFVEATVLNAAMLPAPFASRDLFPHNGPLWSLFFEMAINIAYAAGLWRLGRRPLLAIATLGMAGMIVAVLLDPASGLDVGWNRATAAAGLARVTYGFLLGVVIARAKAPPAVRGAAGTAMAAFLVALMLAFLLAPVPVAAVPWRDLAFAVAVAPLTVWLGSGVVAGNRTVRLLYLLGLVSYPLYALHLPVMDAAGIIALHLRMGVVPASAVMVVACVVTAFLAERFYDVPVRTFLTRRLPPSSRGMRPAVDLPGAGG